MNLTATDLAAIYAEELAADELDMAREITPEWVHPDDRARDLSDYFNREDR